ncbi:T6SS phospholipase effector Tle1-like catalytic domain-containing protein [Stenotrophomonas beteli]
MSESNVSRLFDVYDADRLRSEERRRKKFSSYIQGVGTEALKEIGDTGTGWHARAGAAAGWGGEGRVNWMLMQVQDHLLDHFAGTTVTRAMGFESTAPVARKMSADLRLSLQDVERLAQAARMPLSNYLAVNQGEKELDLRNSLSGGFWNTVHALQRVRGTHLARADHASRRAVLQERRAFLERKVAPFQKQNPRVDRIRISVFGFSRGATEARVFCNWLGDACDPGPGPLRLCGIPVQIDFMGLFDTVASVGAAQSFFEAVFDGHGGWAAAEDLRIPSDVRRCVHMVAAHEVRGSFPVDLVDGANCEQIIYPGVHSDVGGGYAPGEQGRSPNDADKLSQIPLCDMYRHALAAGVPLLPIAEARVELQRQFEISPTLRQHYNAYLKAMAPFLPAMNPASRANRTAALMYAHYRQYLLWRRQHLDDFAALPGFQRASAQDRADLRGGNTELAQEVWGMRYNNATRRVRSTVVTSHHGMATPPPYNSIPAFDFVQAKLRGQKEQQWLDGHIEQIWASRQVPPEPVATFLDGYVHDSRAWFKPFGLDDDEWLHVQQRERDAYRQRMQELDAIEQAHRQERERMQRAGQLFQPRVPLAMSVQELEELTAWREHPENYEEALQLTGREYHWQWGYLRWRTCYLNPPGVAVAEASARRWQRAEDAAA